MRFYEYESRQILAREGIPVAEGGLARSAEEAKGIAAQVGGPVVLKSQVLTGGRMKAGGVKFADTPEEAEAHARDILQLEIGGHKPRGVLVDARAAIKQEYYAGGIYDGFRKLPTYVLSDMGGIDIEEVPEPAGAARGARRGRRGGARGARADGVRDQGRADRLGRPPRRGRQRHRVRRQPRPGHRGWRRLADPVRRRSAPRRQARQLLRDRRQPERLEGRKPHEARAREARRGQDRRDDEHRLEHAGGHRRPRRDQGPPRARLRTRPA